MLVCFYLFCWLAVVSVIRFLFVRLFVYLVGWLVGRFSFCLFVYCSVRILGSRCSCLLFGVGLLPLGV